MDKEIRRLLLEFNIIQINIDNAGGGTTLKDLLAQPYLTETGRAMMPILDMDDKDYKDIQGLHILRMVNFTRPVINDMYIRLKADMQHKRMEFPIDLRRHSDRELERIGKEIIETKREMLVLQAEGKGNHFVFDVPSQFKKDRVTAFVLANQASNEYLYALGDTTISELATGYWV
jgi:hypothetical protein